MTLQQRDKNHIWHPLTQHKLNPNIIGITKAKGAVLFDDNNNAYIDGIASWYTSMYGHCNDYVNNCVYKQMQQLDHVVFTGFTHEPAVKLSEELIKILPDNQTKLFFGDNGSTSVEIAIKMALQYHANLNHNRNVLLAFEDGFHGDTFGAMSVSGLSVYNGPFEKHFLEVIRIPVPNKHNHNEILNQLKSLNATHAIAGFVYEPLVQGAAGMKMHDADGLNSILKFCQTHNIITIADEVMTGFGKTGRYFASDYIATKPDIICMSKSLTAGLVPMSITSCTQKIYDAFYHDDISKGLFHCHTYSANPIACTAALAGLELLQSDAIQNQIKKIIAAHKTFATSIIKHPKIKLVRQLGIILALDLNIEMERYGELRNQLFDYFMSQGVFLRPLGNTIYILAPFVITNDQLNTIYTAITNALDDF